MSAAVRHGVDARLTSRPACAHALALCLLALPATALAQTATAPSASAIQAYDIPAGALTPALNRFAQQAGVALSFEPVLAQNRRTAGLRGSYGVAEGFAALLAGTGLEAVRADNGAWSLRPQPRADGATLLAPLRIAGEQPVGENASLHAGHVSTLDRAQLDRIPPTSTGDLFREIPGVLAGNNRNGASLDLNIRGLQGQGRVKMLVDGTESQNSYSKGAYVGRMSHAYVDPDLLGGVTVEKGPNTGPYGAGAVGGVVSMRTLEGQDLIRDGQDAGLRLRGSWGNNIGEATTATGGGRIADDNLSASVAGAWRATDWLELVAAHSDRRSGNYRAGSWNAVQVSSGTPYAPGDEVFNTSQDLRSNLLKARVLLPQAQSLELGYTDLENQFGESRILLGNSAAQEPLSRAEKRSWTARYAWQPEDSTLWNLRANLWKVRTDELRGEGYSATDPFSNRTQSQGGELWNTSTRDLIDMPVRLRYGLSYMSEESRITRGQAFGDHDPDGERRMLGVFMQADVALTERLTLDAALRGDHYQVRGMGFHASPVPGQAAQEFHIDHADTRLQPGIGIHFRLWDDDGLRIGSFLRYTEGWRPPTAKETLSAYMADQWLVRPEVAHSSELGLDLAAPELLTAADRLRVTLTLFDNRVDDYLYGGVFGAFGQLSNIDRARFQGVEALLDYDSGHFFAQYSLTHYSKVAFCGAPVTWVDPAAGKLGCESRTDPATAAYSGLYAPAKRSQNANLGARWLDRRLTLGARFNKSAEPALRGYGGWAAYEVFDAYGSFRITPQLELGVSVENLRDRYYLEAGTSPFLAVPAPGRTTKASLTYTF